MRKITKQIGKTHCGLASIANCTNYTEYELHSKIDFKELPKGLTIDELYSFLQTIKKSDNSIGSIEKIVYGITDSKPWKADFRNLQVKTDVKTCQESKF